MRITITSAGIIVKAESGIERNVLKQLHDRPARFSDGSSGSMPQLTIAVKKARG